MMRLFLISFISLTMTSCCDICQSIIPSLRPMPEWTEDNPPDMDVGIYYIEKLK